MGGGGYIREKGGRGGINRGFACLVLPGVCSHPKAPSRRSDCTHNSPRGAGDDNKTSSANAAITRHHSAEPLITQTISFKMARLAASPEIYRRSICVCRIREQVNQVSGELIQVSGMQSTSWALANTKCSTSTCQPASFFSPFLFSQSHHILFVFLAGVSFTAPAEQLSRARLVNIDNEF